MTRALAILAFFFAGCGSDTASPAGAMTDAGNDADAAETPTVDQSCTALCAKKMAAACAKDPPAGDCASQCPAGFAAPPGDPPCLAEYAAEAACIAKGQVVCSVDQESTPVAICGAEQRTLSACLVPGASDAGS